MMRAALLLTGATVSFLFGLIVEAVAAERGKALPQGFVYLKDIDPTIVQDVRYATPFNFTGARVPGYDAPECVLLREVAMALKAAQDELRAQNLGLKVYDCYRPRRAVRAFVDWVEKTGSKGDERHYPHTSRADLVKLGYISAVSSHSYGTAVDLTLIALPFKASQAEAGKSYGSCVAPMAEREPDEKSRHGNRLRLLRHAESQPGADRPGGVRSQGGGGAGRRPGGARSNPRRRGARTAKEHGDARRRRSALGNRERPARPAAAAVRGHEKSRLQRHPRGVVALPIHAHRAPIGAARFRHSKPENALTPERSLALVNASFVIGAEEPDLPPKRWTPLLRSWGSRKVSDGRCVQTDEFNREALGLLASSGRPLSQIAGELGIPAGRLRAWRNCGDWTRRRIFLLGL